MRQHGRDGQLKTSRRYRGSPWNALLALLTCGGEAHHSNWMGHVAGLRMIIVCHVEERIRLSDELNSRPRIIRYPVVSVAGQNVLFTGLHACLRRDTQHSLAIACGVSLLAGRRVFLSAHVRQMLCFRSCEHTAVQSASRAKRDLRGICSTIPLTNLVWSFSRRGVFKRYHHHRWLQVALNVDGQSQEQKKELNTTKTLDVIGQRTQAASCLVVLRESCGIQSSQETVFNENSNFFIQWKPRNVARSTLKWF